MISGERLAEIAEVRARRPDSIAEAARSVIIVSGGYRLDHCYGMRGNCTGFPGTRLLTLRSSTATPSRVGDDLNHIETE